MSLFIGGTTRLRIQTNRTVTLGQKSVPSVPQTVTPGAALVGATSTLVSGVSGSYPLGRFAAVYAFDSTKANTGAWDYASWISADPANRTNQRIWIDLGQNYKLTGFRLTNLHNLGIGGTDAGIKNFAVKVSASKPSDTYNSGTNTVVFTGVANQVSDSQR